MMIDGKQSISDALDLIEEAFESIKNISLKNYNNTDNSNDNINDSEVINKLMYKHSYGIKLIKHNLTSVD